MEQWRPIPDFDDYAVSDEGHVMRLTSKKGRLAGTRLSTKRRSPDGYVRMRLYRDGKEFPRRLHCLVMLAFHGPPPPGQEVNHRDGDKENCSLGNLEYVTHAANMAHAAAMPNYLATRPRGATHGNAKLTDDKARAIYRLAHEEGRTDRDIAEQFGVSRTSVGLIRNGRSWRHAIS